MSGLYLFKAVLGVSPWLSVAVGFQPFDLQVDAALVLISQVQAMDSEKVV